MKLRVVLLACIVAVGAALVAGACTSSADGRAESEVVPTSAAVSDAVGPSVAIVGDSITEFGQDVLLDRLGTDWYVAIDGKSGYTILQQRPAANALAEADPSQAIINLGTNDVFRDRSTEQISTDLESVVGEFAGATCIHLVTLAEGMEDAETGADWTDAAVAANQAIGALTARHDRVDVIDWAARLQRDVREGEPDGPMLFDTVHPTDVGHAALAELYAEALDSCGG